MDTENNQTNDARDASDSRGTADTRGTSDTHRMFGAAENQASAASSAEAPTMNELLAEAPIPSVVGRWITCMRKAGISLSYSLEKRHIPDMDKEPRSPSGNVKSAQSNAGAEKCSSPSCKGSVDNMSASGTCRIRYFDLALGAMALLSASMLLKCCFCVKRRLF